MNSYQTNSNLFVCPVCGNALTFKAGDVICEKCPKTYARVKSDITVFNGCVDSNPSLVKLIYKLDECLFSKLLPRILAPFEYLIASAE